MASLGRVCCFFPTCIVSFFALLLIPISARVHTLDLKNDLRTYFMLSSFGFFENGVLEVHLKNFRFSPANTSKTFGFSLDKTTNDAISAYLENHQDKCVLHDGKQDLELMNVILFTMDLKNKKLKVTCSKSMTTIQIQKINPSEDDTGARRQRAVKDKFSDSFLLHRKKRNDPSDQATNLNASPNQQSTSQKESSVNSEPATKMSSVLTSVTKDAGGLDTSEGSVGTSKVIKMTAKDVPVQSDDKTYTITDLGEPCGIDGLELPIIEKKNGAEYETGFIVRILNASEEGLYNLYFHNCPNYDRESAGMYIPTLVNLTVDIVERNGDNFLSAGEMPLPSVYFFMSVLFFLSGCHWIFVLRKSSAADVFKIHYLMAVLIYLKSFSLLFHGINFHFIQSSGCQIEGWAVLYYITHLLKGALLFITIVLIGTGWAWIKHIISDKEKKIFMIVIPLQVLANVAEIIIEESEEGDSAHFAWREVFILVDLLCCGAILFPVVWSIRHLQEASQTDGKAAINLKKLKLFRHFYIMIVCYIYFTRIIVYLLRITVPFKYEWLDETFRAVATLVFFVMTGYKFRPASNNPYLQLPQNDDEIEMEEVLTQCGAMEGVTKVGRIKISEKEYSSTRKESSLEYD